MFRLSFSFLPVWPAPMAHIVAYIAYLSKENWAQSTISVHISAISFAHKINSWQDPTESFLIKKLKEGCKRLRGSMTMDIRRPITFPILKQLITVLPAICSSSFEVCLFRSVFSLAYFGFMRVGEYACISKNNQVGHALRIGDVVVNHNNSIDVLFQHSKTDQRGNCMSIKIHAADEELCCPVRNMQRYLAIRPHVLGPLFLHFNHDPLTIRQVSSIMKSGVKLLGLSPSEFSPHSLRIGAATSAALGGASEESIKLMGRWQSGAFRSYIRPERLISNL